MADLATFLYHLSIKIQQNGGEIPRNILDLVIDGEETAPVRTRKPKTVAFTGVDVRKMNKAQRSSFIKDIVKRTVNG